jgi:hypothetical protein
MNKFVAKTSNDIAEDIVCRWLSFIRAVPKCKNPTGLVQYIIFYKFVRLGMNHQISGEKTDFIIQGFVNDCQGMDIYHPDVSENLTQRIASVLS